MGLSMTQHALLRFRERIEPGTILTDEEIQTWCQHAWAFRYGGKATKRSKEHISNIIFKRPFRDIMCEYLSCRSPTGKPAFMALSPQTGNEDPRYVLTVFDIWQWNNFNGTKVNMHQVQRERIIAKLREEEPTNANDNRIQ